MEAGGWEKFLDSVNHVLAEIKNQWEQLLLLTLFRGYILWNNFELGDGIIGRMVTGVWGWGHGDGCHYS